MATTTVADADVLVVADVSKFAADLRRKLTPIMRQIEATLDILADVTQFQRSVDEAVDDADGRTATINVEADTSAVVPEVRAVTRQIDGTDATINVNVDVDRDVDRVRGQFARRFSSIGGEAGSQFASGFADTAVTGMVTAGRAVTSAFTNPVVLGLAAIAAALLAIPAGAAIAAASLVTLGGGFLTLGALALSGNERVASAFERMKNTIVDTFTDAAEPLIEPLVRAFNTIGNAIRRTGPQLREAFTALAPAIEVIAEGLAGFIDNVMPGFVRALKAAEPLLEEFGRQLPQLGEALNDLFRALALSGPESVSALSAAFSILNFVIIAAASLILGLTATFGLLKDAIGFVIGVWQSLFEFIGQFSLTNVSIAIVEFVTGAVTQLQTFLGSVISVLSQVRGIIADNILQAVNTAIQFFRDGFNTLVQIASAVPGQIFDAVSNVVGFVGGVFRDAGNSAIEGLRSGINTLINLARGIPNQIRGALGGIGNILFNAGVQIIQGLINGISSKIRDLRETLGAVTRLIPRLKGPEDVDKKLLTPAGRFIMEGLIAGIDDGVALLERKLQGITTMFAPSVQAGTPAVMAQNLGPRLGSTTSTTSTNNRSFAPVINVTVNGDANGDQAANAIIRRLLAVGV